MVSRTPALLARRATNPETVMCDSGRPFRAVKWKNLRPCPGRASRASRSTGSRGTHWSSTALTKPAGSQTRLRSASTHGALSDGSRSRARASFSRRPAYQPHSRNTRHCRSGALASSRSKDSTGTGCGFRFGTFTAGNAGTSGSSFWPGAAAQARAVCRNCSRTRMVLASMNSLPRPGSFRIDVANAETVRPVMPRRLDGLQSLSKRSKVAAHAGRFLILPVVEFILQVGARLLGHLLVGGAGAPALALPGVRVHPLEDQVRAVLEVLNPDGHPLFVHPRSLAYNVHGLLMWNAAGGEPWTCPRRPPFFQRAGR